MDKDTPGSKARVTGSRVDGTQSPSPDVQKKKAAVRGQAPSGHHGVRNSAMREHSRSMVRVVGILVMACVIALGVVNVLFPDLSLSERENRNLAQLEAPTLDSLADGSWFKDTSTWFSDQFVGRDSFMSMRSTILRGLGQKENNGVYFAKDGYLMQQPATPKDDAIVHTQKSINDFVAAYPDISHHVMIVPDAATVMPSWLPANAPVRDQGQDIAAFTGGLDGPVILDARSPLEDHVNEGVYYKTDHHWTSLGAYNVFLSNAGALGIDNPVEYTPYTVSADFEGTLAAKSGDYDSHDKVDVYAPSSDVDYYVNYVNEKSQSTSVYNVEKLDHNDKYQVFFGGNHPLVTINTTSESGKTLLVFKDSYANSFVSFLVPYYSTIIMVDPRYYYDDLSQIIHNSMVTDTLFLYSYDTIATDTSLADVLDDATASVNAADEPSSKS